MKKLMVLGVLAFFLVFLAGCKPQEETTLAGKAFVGGSQGLSINFLPSQPPAEVFDTDNPFFISVRIENKGEFDIQNKDDIDVSITGVNPADFKVSASDLMKSSPDPLRGVRIDAAGNIVAGDFTTVDFPEMNYFTTVSGSVPFTIRANLCYEYGTKSQGKLCVRKDLRGVTGEAGICNPVREVPAENSGAPVQITNFKQNVAGTNKVDFFFTIKKVGGFSDSLHKTGTSCDTTITNRDLVYIEISDTGLGQLVCSGLRDGANERSGFVTLINGEREVRCSQTITSLADLEKVIDINLRYSYKQFVDTQILIKHAS